MSAAVTFTPLVPLARVIPSWSTRRIADACRKGAIPGAVKLGHEWLISQADLDRWLASLARPGLAKTSGPTVDDALAVLRARGLV